MKVTALAGGIGAAKLLVGLAAVMPAEDITVIVNTGDDIELYGLRICPDIDTVIYTLAGIVNQETGWGIAGDTFEALKRLAEYGEPAWFNLGDRDLATHIYRTARLSDGWTLSRVTDHLRRSLGVSARVLPMTDDYAPTRVETDEGEMHLQEYFVRRRCEPRVRRVLLDQAEAAPAAPEVEDALRSADAVIVCPSNPMISIGPILAVGGVSQALRESRATVAAVTPIIGGRALKGPAAEMLRDLGHAVSAAGVAALYCDFVDLFVLDQTDAALAPEIEKLGVRTLVTNTVMTSVKDKAGLARIVLDSVTSGTAEGSGR